MRLQNQTDTPSLTADELKSVLSDAIQRQGEEERARELAAGMMSEADALEAARSLNISEEHVRAALAQRHRAGLREKKREMVRQKRLIGLILAAFFTLLAGLVALIPFLPFIKFLPLAGMAALCFFLFVRWRAPVSDAEADRVDLPPQPGTCQVCGAPAVSERSTLCREHTYGGSRPSE